MYVLTSIANTGGRIRARYTLSAFGIASSASEMELTGKIGRHAMRYVGAFLFLNLPTLLAQAGPE